VYKKAGTDVPLFKFGEKMAPFKMLSVFAKFDGF
jgi:hypothetical protein